MPADRRLIEARLKLHQLAIGSWAAQALFAANGLGVFELLEAGPRSAEQVASELGTDEEATARLLGALVAIDLLERGDGARFRNGPAASAYLTTAGSESMATWVSLIDRWNESFAHLASSIRSGDPAEPPEDHLGGTREYTRRFIHGMHDYAVGPGRELATHLDLTSRRRLLDVGGGPGTYSLMLAERNPELACVVFDLPEVVAIADDVIARHGLTDRVVTAAGDYHTDQLPDGFDVALISNVLHQEDRAACLEILAKTRSALAAGGIVVVQAMFLNETGDGPMWPALHNLLMLLVYRGGKAYSASETSAMLVESGFEEPQLNRMSPFNAESFIVARRG